MQHESDTPATELDGTAPSVDQPNGRTSRDKSARWDQVLALLARERRLSVTRVADELGVSESTVRRDFVEMEDAQLARRTHGGIVAIDVAYSLAARSRGTDPEAEGRERIADYVSSLVRQGQIIGMNGGRTTSAIARRIGARTDLPMRDGLPGLTVVCAALNIATDMVLRPSIRTVVLGGVAEPYSFELTGPLASATMRDLWLDVMIIGAVGLDIDAGLTCRSDAEAGVTRTMIAHSRRTIAVVTADKIGTRVLAGICPLGELTDLVVAGEVDADLRRFLDEQGVALTIV
ncbi:DeoR/GlpR family DNA-binding transcription regulator [Devriesea agamarum]|uniref:DeoR/GlpR family DNA-binding transcription regulator n=1 Tax=Devriesea agamarum TaxID=472569 RepID=UPI000A01E43A|nr:DeoR/GlpR family DNA-binding transcription regulator [Devriesea agamarum]